MKLHALAERLSDAGHTSRRDHDDEDAGVRPQARVAAAKVRSADLRDQPGEVRERIDPAPGKLTPGDLDEHAMTPAQALAYSDFLLRSRVDRRAEHDREGSLASAFSFIQDSRGGEPLPAELCARLAEELGVDLAAVRVHTDDRAAEAAARLSARAFTIGDDIYFARGAYDPSSEAGVELIAHEVAHVAQQRGASPSPSPGRVSRPGDPHEREAEAFASRFARDDRGDARGADPARWINELRRSGGRVPLPMREELEAHFGTSLDFVEAYAGDAATLACRLLQASAFAVRNVVAFADPSPQRDTLLHELAHVIQTGGRGEVAPDRFRPATLAVSTPAAAAEVDARAVARGAAVTATASSDVIHREGPGDKPAATETAWTLDDAKEAFVSKFLPKVPKRAESDPYSFAAVGPGDNAFLLLFSKTSKDMFQLAKYQEAIGHVAPEQKKKSAEDLQKLHKQHWQAIGLVQPRLGNPDTSSWAYVDPSEPITQQVLYLQLEERKKPDAKEMWATYCAVAGKLHDKGSIQGFQQVNLGPRQYPVNNKQRTAYTEEEYKALEDQLTAAIIAEPKYKWRPKSYWRTFYKEVCETAPLLPQGAQGKAFKEIVKQDIGGFAENEVMFKSDELTSDSKKRFADGYSISGTSILLECKSGTTPEDKFIAQAGDYAKIVRATNPIPAYSPPDAKDRTFDRVIYTFPTVELSRQYAPMIMMAFKGLEDRVEILPPPDAVGIATVKANPSFAIPLKQKDTATHTIDRPPVVHPGLIAERAVIRTDAPNSSTVVGGTLDFGIDLGGGLTGSKISKPITAESGAGRIENKLPGIKAPGLEKILGRLQTDAKLTDDGVEATITVTAGPSGVPNLNLSDSTLTAKYGTSGGLAVEGTVGIAHTSGKVSGKVTVGYAAGQWRFEGTATVSDGIVPGLSGFTAKVKYDAGKWTFGVDQVSYERKLGAVTLKGTAYGLEYDVDKGDFGAMLMLEADLGMFGKASARGELEHNQLKKLEVSYDSPEFKYPAKSAQPSFKGTIGGTLTYQNDQFSGSLRGSANLNIPALQKLAGESGVGLAVTAEVNPDGTYSGTIATTTPLTFGKHLQIPSISCTIGKEGDVSGSFELKVVKIKFLDEASIKCTVTKDGVEIEEAKVEAPFGAEGKDKFWGKISAGYSKASGLKIGGTVNYEIKKGMVATGELTYSTETNEVSLAMTVSEITLLDKQVSKTLFKAAKQIPIVNVYGLGIYIDIGFELGFDFGFKLGLKPTVEFDGLSLDTFEFNKIAAKLELLGELSAKLTGTPKLGLGIFALSPSILRGGGGLKVPIVGEAKIKPTGTISVSYSPQGDVEGDAKIGMAMTFGITGSVKPYAEFAVLDGLWNPSWEGDALAQFEILKPKELFNFVVDLGGDLTKKEAPELPASNAAKEPSPPVADKILPETKGAPEEKSGPGSVRSAEGPTSPPAEGGDEGPFSLAALAPLLEKLPGAAAVKKILQKAGQVWDSIKGFFGRIVKAFKSMFESLVDQLEEILDGFAKEGLGYVPKLVKKIVGETVYEIIEPLVMHLSRSADALLELFETDPPTNLGDYMPWVWKVAKKAFNLGASSLTGFIGAIRDMLNNMWDVTKKLITKAVADGWIGVKRHGYYIWRPWPLDDYNFVAAAEFKLSIPGVIDLGRQGPPGFLLSPDGAVALGLYTFLEEIGVPVTFQGWNDKAKEPYNDRWRGEGARG